MEADIVNASPHVVRSLSALCQALQTKDWEKAKKIHTELMTSEYEKHGMWLTGLKRLMDLCQKL
ncbi:hypothetical protein DFQ29_000303 [Apophysomyces sp. BC1021]|nr:hypothetical protein DFQ29_000303 [Apophysomyces sp. BC1021]